MASKKIVLFIVEGPTDETSVSTVLNRIFSSSTVRFQVVHGDVLTKDFVKPEKIISAVNTQIKAFRGNLYKPKDFLKVIHLADMDGAFIPDDAIISEDQEGRHYPYYTESQIYTPNTSGIVSRNERKRRNILKLCSCGKIGGIPYSFYYFSCNLEHVLHNKNNLTDDEKIAFAEEFDLKYADSPDTFIHLMKDESFAVQGSYSETWKFIQEGKNSLKRYTNFGLALPEKSDWQPEP